MQIDLKISLDEPLVLPISYQHIIQAIFYKLMGDSNSKVYHNSGYSIRNKVYKPFSFSNIIGKYIIQGNNIVFYENIQIKFRSIDLDVISNISSSVIKEGISIRKETFNNIEMKVFNQRIYKDKVLIKMLSPMTCYITDDNKKTIYYNPVQEEFYDAIQYNASQKYEAFCGKKTNITIRPINININDKCITKYKNTIIEGYLGEYMLSGETEMLDYLYNCGLGGKNAQGFGFFDLI